MSTGGWRSSSSCSFGVALGFPWVDGFSWWPWPCSWWCAWSSASSPSSATATTGGTTRKWRRSSVRGGAKTFLGNGTQHKQRAGGLSANRTHSIVWSCDWGAGDLGGFVLKWGRLTNSLPQTFFLCLGTNSEVSYRRFEKSWCGVLIVNITLSFKCHKKRTHHLYLSTLKCTEEFEEEETASNWTQSFACITTYQTVLLWVI